MKVEIPNWLYGVAGLACEFWAASMVCFLIDVTHFSISGTDAYQLDGECTAKVSQAPPSACSRSLFSSASHVMPGSQVGPGSRHKATRATNSDFTDTSGAYAVVKTQGTI